MSNHETPAQRRTRLIEQFALHHWVKYDTIWSNTEFFLKRWTDELGQLADAVIAATPQEPEALDKPVTRLLSLCEQAKSCGAMWRDWLEEFESIKKDIGARKV